MWFAGKGRSQGTVGIHHCSFSSNHGWCHLCFLLVPWGEPSLCVFADPSLLNSQTSNSSWAVSSLKQLHRVADVFSSLHEQ